MAPRAPTWLPPLKSNKYPYEVSVELKLSSHVMRSRPRLLLPRFFIKTIVSVEYRSTNKDNRRTLKGLSSIKEKEFGRHELYDPDLRTETIKKECLDKLGVPFDFDKDHLATLASEDAGLVREKYAFYDSSPTILKLTKKVVVEDKQFKGWCSWYDENKRVDKKFQEKYESAICRRLQKPRKYSKIKKSGKDSKIKKSSSSLKKYI